jgi:Spy/CpxP family protein refolding chaperone
MKNLVALLVAAFVMTTPAWGQDKADEAAIAALRNAVQTDKRALVAATLKLTDAEAKKFWPIYDSYQRSSDMLNRERNTALEGLVARDRPMSDLYARNLANELINVEEQEIKARRKMHNAVMRALPPRKAARYLQLEANIRAVRAYDIAAAFPLVQ